MIVEMKVIWTQQGTALIKADLATNYPTCKAQRPTLTTAPNMALFLEESNQPGYGLTKRLHQTSSILQWPVVCLHRNGCL